jgi:hypothetical protein
MGPLRRSTALCAERVVAPVHAVEVTAVALAAQVEHSSARVGDALNLPEIVHSRA